MDPTREDTYKFLDGFIGEMAALFPDPYFHIGGDEVNPQGVERERADHAVRQGPQPQRPEGLQAYFNQRISKILEKHNKIMVGWDEVLHPGPPHRRP